MNYDPEDSIEHDAFERLASELTLKHLQRHYNTLTRPCSWITKSIKEYHGHSLNEVLQDLLADDKLDVDAPLLEAYCNLMCSKCEEAATFRKELFTYLAFHKPMYELVDDFVQQNRDDTLIEQYQQRNEP